MITISELKGNRLKKDLGLERAFFRWHNKNKTWGNFGINLITKGDSDNFELTGNYRRPSGEVYSLRFGILYQIVGNIPISTYEELISLLKNLLKVRLL